MDSCQLAARESPRPSTPALPPFVRRELDGYLDCGLLCRGFARLKCDACAEQHLTRALTGPCRPPYLSFLASATTHLAEGCIFCRPGDVRAADDDIIRSEIRERGGRAEA